MNLGFLVPQDSPSERKFYSDLFVEMITMLGQPFASDTFDFGDDTYFNKVYAFAEELSKMEELRSSKVVRANRDGLYINRTYYGLYAMLNELRSRVVITKPEWLQPKQALV